MSEKTPSERLLMTLPKPIYDWLSSDAKRLGVTVQDRTRVILEGCHAIYSKYASLSEEDKNIGITVLDIIGKMLKEVESLAPIPVGAEDVITEICYRLGKETYDEFATERRRLTILQIPEDYKSEEYKAFWSEHDMPVDFALPVIQKTFYPLLHNKITELYESDIYEAMKKAGTELHEYDICKAAKQVAELENKLLSVCHDDDKLFEASPFKCRVYHKEGKWIGWFRVCLNSERTPTFADAIRVTS